MDQKNQWKYQKSLPKEKFEIVWILNALVNGSMIF